ncbi:MAG TPA: hypothetical protein VFE62_05210 [Gemmataceae bacterium]|nr:hypothetical protein [Gemmataceae bacterium]
MSKSSQKTASRKAAVERPKKPYPDFPLSPHASGAWQKKIRGKVHYFGRWASVINGKLTRIEGDGWQEALEQYNAEAADLHAGRTPRTKSDALTIKELCNRFLTAKQHKLDAGEMSARMFAEYKLTTDRLVARFGKDRLVVDLAADDFQSLRADLAKQYGPVRLGNEIQKVRTIFKHAVSQGLIDKPVRYGEEFKKPGKRVMRLHRAKSGKRLFDANELGALIDAAGVPLKAMILLGINAAFGNADCGHLRHSALDLEAGWVTFPRPKTGIERRAFLWPETIEALKASLAERPTPKDRADADKVFITKYGNAWSDGGISGAVTLEMSKLLKRPRCPACGKINAADAKRCSCGWKPTSKQPWKKTFRPGLGFYALRHTFRTVADATRDFPAVRFVMGHADDTIDDVYREGIDDSRLQAVSEYVRIWVFGKPGDGAGAGKGTNVCEGSETSGSLDGAQQEDDQRPRLKVFAG